ncbi:Protein kinase domain-containing protein [Gordonia malaquae]|uniref:non-specific serine/threonine protein kinase n=1 Tax=Gordonia malaquae NBRC 108250 TaxID=1223542 RepID=M3UUW3_GORML|nr:serine/threonine-protein kinase [Gordonia malaquae]GAC79247.1 putative serine/threonine protein kinase [Gordonia malaquae NBRC 108250]SEE36783.1 Protein kinase domain-containing protein [Gordonia malaquae]
MSTLNPGDAFSGLRVVAAVETGEFVNLHLVENSALGREEILKTVRSDPADPGRRDRFALSTKALASLDHAGIVEVYDIGVTDDTTWMTMARVPGTPLGGRPLSVRAAARAVHDVGAALDHAHRRGVVYRDVRPANITAIIGPNDSVDRVVLIDCGIASHVDDAPTTRDGTFIGSPAYSAPELFMGDAAAPASDQYALACTAFELFTGEKAYGQRSLDAVVDAHVNGRAPVPSDIRPELEVLDSTFRRALDADPTRRFPTCSAFAEALDSALAPAAPTRRMAPTTAPLADEFSRSTQVIHSAAPNPTRGSRRPRVARVLAWTTAAVAVVGVAGVALAVAGGYLTPSPPSDSASEGTAVWYQEASDLPSAYTSAGLQLPTTETSSTPGAIVAAADSCDRDAMARSLYADRVAGEGWAITVSETVSSGVGFGQLGDYLDTLSTAVTTVPIEAVAHGRDFRTTHAVLAEGMEVLVDDGQPVVLCGSGHILTPVAEPSTTVTGLPSDRTVTDIVLLEGRHTPFIGSTTSESDVPTTTESTDDTTPSMERSASDFMSTTYGFAFRTESDLVCLIGEDLVCLPPVPDSFDWSLLPSCSVDAVGDLLLWDHEEYTLCPAEGTVVNGHDVPTYDGGWPSEIPLLRSGESFADSDDTSGWSCWIGPDDDTLGCEHVPSDHGFTIGEDDRVELFR